MKISKLIPIGLTKYSPKTITEAADVDKVADKLTKLTDSNAHTEAAVELAKFVGDKKWIKITQAIEAIHDAEGSIPVELSKYRTEIVTRLINAVGFKMGAEAKKKISSAL